MELAHICLADLVFSQINPTFMSGQTDFGVVVQQFHGTTILGVKRGNRVVLGGDGQVSLGNTIMKANARKVRRLYQGKVLAGFAGATADAFTLFEKFEAKLEQYGGNLTRAAVELAKEWRTDKMLRNLEALLIVASQSALLVITGSGDVIEPQEEFIAIGSGGQFAHSAAKALYNNTDLSPREIVERSLGIAASICVYTNDTFTIEELS